MKEHMTTNGKFRKHFRDFHIAHFDFMPIILSFTLSHLWTQSWQCDNSFTAVVIYIQKPACDEFLIENDGSDPYCFSYLHNIGPHGRDELTHLPLVWNIYVNGVSIGSGNGLSPVRRQAITWTNPGLLRIEILVKFESEFCHFHSRKCIWKYRMPQWWPFYPGVGGLVNPSGTKIRIIPG